MHLLGNCINPFSSTFHFCLFDFEDSLILLYKRVSHSQTGQPNWKHSFSRTLPLYNLFLCVVLLLLAHDADSLPQ